MLAVCRPTEVEPPHVTISVIPCVTTTDTESLPTTNAMMGDISVGSSSRPGLSVSQSTNLKDFNGFNNNSNSDVKRKGNPFNALIDSARDDPVSSFLFDNFLFDVCCEEKDS